MPFLKFFLYTVLQLPYIYWMPNSKITATEQEVQLIKASRNNPELFDLFSEVIQTYQDDPKQFKDLNAIETYLLEKVKAIGNNALEHWAKSLDVEVSAIEQGRKGVRKHSKKNSTSLPYSVQSA